jgi:hypothetical protein
VPQSHSCLRSDGVYHKEITGVCSRDCQHVPQYIMNWQQWGCSNGAYAPELVSYTFKSRMGYYLRTRFFWPNWCSHFLHHMFCMLYLFSASFKDVTSESCLEVLGSYCLPLAVGDQILVADCHSTETIRCTVVRSASVPCLTHPTPGTSSGII